MNNTIYTFKICHYKNLSEVFSKKIPKQNCRNHANSKFLMEIDLCCLDPSTILSASRSRGIPTWEVKEPWRNHMTHDCERSNIEWISPHTHTYTYIFYNLLEIYLHLSSGRPCKGRFSSGQHPSSTGTTVSSLANPGKIW